MVPFRPRRVAAMLAAFAVISVGCGEPAPSATAPPSSPSSSPRPAASSPLPASAEPTSSNATDRPIGSTGTIVVLRANGSLSVVEAGGHSTVLSDTVAGTFGFPAWSPDGRRIAAVRGDGTDASVVVFDAGETGAAAPAKPVVIFSKPGVQPFYLFWAPDGTAVSFLATEGTELSLRIAPPDGSAPLDGSGPGSVVRSGNPFYYDWIGRDRLMAHIGLGPDGLLGEIGLDGKAAAKALGEPADFRSAVASHDGRSVGFIRTTPGGDEIVLAARDGSSEHAIPAFGQSAIDFDPAGDTLATIGPTETGEAAGFPVGPVRLIDARSGAVRTLVEGRVASFWWSPDGKTIAALRLQPAGTAASSPAASSELVAPTASAAPSGAIEIRLLFVDVATGKVRSQPIVQPSPTFVNGIIAYFDQYALSHRLWAPDSSSILFPEVDDGGIGTLTVLYPDGDPSLRIAGEIGFWSP
jgi:TolB protein